MSIEAYFLFRSKIVGSVCFKLAHLAQSESAVYQGRGGITPTLTRTPQLSFNPNRKPQIKCAQMNIAHCSFSHRTIFTQDKETMVSGSL